MEPVLVQQVLGVMGGVVLHVVWSHRPHHLQPALLFLAPKDIIAIVHNNVEKLDVISQTVVHEFLAKKLNIVSSI